MKPTLCLISTLALLLSIGLLGKGIIDHSGLTVMLAWMAANMSLLAAISTGRKA